MRFCIPLRLGSSPALGTTLAWVGQRAPRSVPRRAILLSARRWSLPAPRLWRPSRVSSMSPKTLRPLAELWGHPGACPPAPMCPESEPFLPKSVRRRAVMISLWKGSNPFSCSTFSANRLNLRGLCLFGRLVQGVEQVLVEAAAWADSIGETANAPTRGMDSTEFA